MEVPNVKENLPVGYEDLHQTFKSVKMTSTPRQPLVDLKQIGRPVEKVCVKSATLLGTPKPSKLHRKMKPLSLQRGLEKECSRRSMGSEVVSMLPDKMDEIFEEDVEEFVTQILNHCAQDMNAEDAKTANCGEEMKASENESNSLKQLDEGDTDDLAETNEQTDDVNERSRSLQRHDFVSQFGDLSVNEEYLLDESHYSECSESFQDSTKSDEELLASFVQTPGVRAVFDTDIGECATGDNIKPVYTPAPTFLEKVAVMQRVKNATSNLANWVFPSSVTSHHIQQVPTGKSVKLVHDVACSPMPQKITKTSDSVSAESQGTLSEDLIDERGTEFGEEDITKKSDCSGEHTEDNFPCDLVEKGMCPDGYRKSLSTSKEENLEQIAEEQSEDQSVEKSPIQTDHSVTSVACSPMYRPMCDFSVQNEVDTQTALCSPIRFASHDKFTQNEVQLHSVLCCPVHFPGCDVSIQNSVDTQSVMCSPIQTHTQSVMCSPIPAQVCDVSIQNEADTCSTMCSPMRIPVHDVSIQNAATSQSIMCSPMVPRPSHDKSVLATGPQLVDSSVMTDVKSYTSISVSVEPEMISVGTEMDDQPMLTIGTSMTPLKLDKKQGKKLTADDVRKQHPRVLANEFETLRLQNTRLESQVHGLEKDRKKLVAYEELQKSFAETKQSLDDLEHKHEREMLNWQETYDTLQTELRSVKSEHEAEILKVRGEYESNDYREHFYASQKLVQELQAELDQYASLADDVESTTNLQTKMQNSVTDCSRKIKSKAEWIKLKETEINRKTEHLKVEQLRYTDDMCKLVEDKQCIQTERDQMAQIVAQCKDGMLELDSQLKRTQAELAAAEDTMLVMREENDSVTKERDVLKSQCDKLTAHNVDLQSEVNRLKDELQTSQSTVRKLSDQLEDVNKRLSEATDKLVKDETTYKDTLEKKKLLIRNLERTLQNREIEIDSQDKELFECREEILKQTEAAKAHDIQEKTLTKQLETTKRELNQLIDCCAKLRAKEQEVRCTLTGTLEELSYTQQFASDVMRKQGTEITDASSAIDELVDHMEDVLANLCRRAGIEDKSSVDEDTGSNVTSTKVNKDSPVKQTSSLVSQVLSAVLSTDTDGTPEPGKPDNTQEPGTLGGSQEPESDGDKTVTDCEQSNIVQDDKMKHSANIVGQGELAVDSPKTLSRKKLGCTGNSAFAPIHSVKPKDSNQSSIMQENSATVAKVTCSKETIKAKTGKRIGQSIHFSEKVESKFVDVCTIGEDVGLTNQLERVTQLFTEVTRVAHIIEKALRSSLNDATFENEDLSSRVSQSSYSKKHLQAELDFTQSELDKSQKVVDELNTRIQDMSDKFESMLDKDVENKVLLDEICRIKEKYHSLQAERDVLNEQISQMLRKMESVTDGSQATGAVDVHSQREILDLKKKVEKYRCMMREKDDQIELITSRASSRIQKLETNWKTADAEVCRFDELVEIVRDVLMNHKLVMQDKELATLISLIDGKVPAASFKKTGNQDDLRPNKTTKQ